MSDKVKYMYDEDGNRFSPVTSSESISLMGGGYLDRIIYKHVTVSSSTNHYIEIDLGQTYTDLMAIQIYGNILGVTDDTTQNYAIYFHFNEEAPIQYFVTDYRDNGGTTGTYNYVCTDGSSSVYLADIRNTQGHFLDLRITGAKNSNWWHYTCICNTTSSTLGVYEFHNSYGQVQDTYSIQTITIFSPGRWKLNR